MSELVSSSELINDISGNYNKCVKAADEIILSLKNVKSELRSSYKGQGEEMAIESFEKTEEHMKLLMECLKQVKKYVDHTGESFKALENHLKAYIR